MSKKVRIHNYSDLSVRESIFISTEYLSNILFFECLRKWYRQTIQNMDGTCIGHTSGVMTPQFWMDIL